jgi:hypothetical protein
MCIQVGLERRFNDNKEKRSRSNSILDCFEEVAFSEHR